MNIEERLSLMKEKIKEISESYTEESIGGWITGNGPVPCKILFIGEAPGKTEVESGEPFVGMAGKNFEHYLNLVGLNRDNIRITNACYFRPIKIKESVSGKPSISNRSPKSSEIKLFTDILNEEINLVDPKLIITLGNTPLKTITDFNSIGECHGNLILSTKINRNVFPMYHPSSLIYNRSNEFKDMYLQDWHKLKEVLKNLI
ncbi:uracil-DNA glycosylase [Clostridium malenominatum]|uniref:Uracil-DNA glycosylase n=1 Tax=Clostridium malenominatum TaxID=1539 RepID=A0ABP3UDQ7_9CLOT